MKKINLHLDKNKKYVIACSYGPDSMALLDAAIKEKLNIVVAHVNYRKRAVSIDEQNNLGKFCEEQNIKCHVLDLLGIKHEGNFQEWARETRYKFFKDICDKENADAVLVAHQQDDVIETYLMQKKRGNYVKYAGISEENELLGVKVLRPLLSYSKQELKDYDLVNNVPFSIDESNLTDHYTRNIFRHHVVEKMKEAERQNILQEIKRINERCKLTKECKTKEGFVALTYEEIIDLLDTYMNKIGEHRDLSRKFIEEIKKAFRTKSCIGFDITKSLLLELDYDEVYFVNMNKMRNYKILFKNSAKTEFLDVDFSSGTEDRKIDLKDKELFVQNVCLKDKIIIKDYSSKISRLFIDWKMPLFLRKIWPGIYDTNGKLLYVPRYRKNFVDNHKSKFLINTEYFEEF